MSRLLRALGLRPDREFAALLAIIADREAAIVERENTVLAREAEVVRLEAEISRLRLMIAQAGIRSPRHAMGGRA
jgi:hypothetical protein